MTSSGTGRELILSESSLLSTAQTPLSPPSTATDFKDCIFRNVASGDFKAEAISERDLDAMLVSVEVRRGVDPAAAAEALKAAVRHKFGLTPHIVVVETGTLSKEFAASVKMPRFADRRN